MREFGGGLRLRAGERRLRGFGEMHGAGVTEKPVQQAAGGRIVELRTLVGGDGAVGGVGGVFVFVARGFEACG